jgi:hypothetical protein
MGLAGVSGREAPTPENIDANSNWFQMPRIHACTVPAEMIEHLTFRHRPGKLSSDAPLLRAFAR